MKKVEKSPKPKVLAGPLTKKQVRELPIGFTEIVRTSPKYFKTGDKKPIVNNRKTTNGRTVQLIGSKNVRVPFITRAFRLINEAFKRKKALEN